MLKLDEEEKKFINAIGDPSRLKILLILWKSSEELTAYKICRRTGLGRSSVSRHIRSLAETGIVFKRIYGEIPLYCINRGNPRAIALTDFFTKIRL